MGDVNIKVSIVSGKAKSSIKALQRETDKLERNVKDVNVAIKNSTSAFKVFAGVVTGAAFIGAIRGLTTGMINFAQSSIQAASDAEETASKFATVFQDIGTEAEASADKLVKSFGLSRNESKELLGATGDLLTGFGFTGKAALDLSSQVNELAVDLASFTNFSGGAKGASEALTKALLGERESVKSLGISILEEDVKKQVAINTANGLTFATNRQAKAQATLQIAVRQSTNAVGDFARTQGSLANQQRILAATTDDVLTSIGTEFLPIVTEIISSTNKWIRSNEDLIVSFAKDAAESFADAVQFIVDTVKSAIDIYNSFNTFLEENENALIAAATAVGVGSIALGIYLVVVNATAISTAIATAATTAFGIAVAILASPITAVVVGLGALGFAAFALVKFWEQNSVAIKSFVADMIEGLIPAVDVTLTALGTLVGIFSTDMATSIEKAKGSLRGLVDSLREEKTAIEDVGNSLEKINFKRKEINQAELEAERQKAADLAAQRKQAAADKLQALIDSQKEIADAEKALKDQLVIEEKDLDTVKNDENLIKIEEQLGLETAIKTAARQRELESEGKFQLAKLELEKTLTIASNKELLTRQVNAKKAAKKRQEDADKRRKTELLQQTNFLSLAASLQNSGNKKFAAIGKAAALTQIAIKTPPAIVNSFEFGSRIGGPVLGVAFGAVAAAAMAAQAASVAGVSFASGGIVPGSSLTGDRVQANLNSGEAVLNKSQQSELLGLANGTRTGTGGSSGETIIPITIELDGEVLTTVVSRHVADGFKLGEVV